MDDIGTYLIVSYDIKRIREWRAVFDSNLEDQAQYGIARESHDGWRRPWWLKRFGY